jgi:hypothetical protein
MASLELIGKFIGPDEIVSMSVSEQKTPEGKQIIDITFKSGRSHIFSKETLDYIVTDEVSDANTVQAKKFTPVVRKIMSVLLEHDLQVGEIEMLFKQLGYNLDIVFNRATNYLFFKNEKEFVPGFDPLYHVSLLMADGVIPKKKEDEKENT